MHSLWKLQDVQERNFFFLFCPAFSDLLCCQSLSYTSSHLASFLGFGSVGQASRAEHHGKWCVRRPLAELLEAEGVLMLFSSNRVSFKAWQKEVKAVSQHSLLGTVLAGSAILQEGACGWWNEKETQIRESMGSTHCYNWVSFWRLTPTFYKA